MDPLIPVCVALVALSAALGVTLQAFIAAHARHAAERLDWARERHELNTRIQAPEAAAAIPPPHLAPPPPESPEDAKKRAEVLRGFSLVGTIAGAE